MINQPFKQMPFAKLPEKPIKQHDFFNIQEKTINLNSATFGNHNVSYRRVGKGQPLLLVHGLMTTGYSWRYVIPHLSKSYQLIIPDLVGCGRSDKPISSSYSAITLAQWIIDFQNALGIYGCICIGNSMGGYIAMQAALIDYKCFSRLINIHSPALPLPRLYALQLALKIPFIKYGLKKIVQLNPSKWAHRNVHYYDESLKSLEEANEYGMPLSKNDGVETFIKFLSQTINPLEMNDFIKTLKERHLQSEKFPMPITLIYARQDPIVPPIVGEKLINLLHDSEIIWMDCASHFAHVDAVDSLCDLVIDILN